LGVAAQREAISSYLNGGDWLIIGEFTEVESGKRADRPQLEKALGGIARALTERGIPSARGGNEWTPMQVARIMARLPAAM
jgi:hypothetical protein